MYEWWEHQLPTGLGLNIVWKKPSVCNQTDQPSSDAALRSSSKYSIRTLLPVRQIELLIRWHSRALMVKSFSTKNGSHSAMCRMCARATGIMVCNYLCRKSSLVSSSTRSLQFVMTERYSGVMLNLIARPGELYNVAQSWVQSLSEFLMELWSKNEITMNDEHWDYGENQLRRL